MAKAAKILCDRCESRMVAGAPFCGSCGYPTTWASHDERAAWEVARYREKTVTAPISTIVGDAQRKRPASRVDVIDRPKPSREKKTFGGLFGRRRAPAATIVLPEPKRVDPVAEEAAPAAVLTMVRPEPAPVAPKPASPGLRAPRVERPVAQKAVVKSDGLVSKVERAMNDNEALVDTPATVLAMRLLNQRVRELDEKVRLFERELAAAKARAEADVARRRKRFGR